MQAEGRWDDAGAELNRAARALEAAGADFVVLCTNTMHKVADRLEDGLGIPLLHLGDATAAAIKAAGIRRVGLLGHRVHHGTAVLPRPARRARARRARARRRRP